ncbi:GAF domain-containing protein [Rapidithrix thailandica]|uniref:GAF domain-containing protein n=1 Tax=Rapidithrix thailandica TaxID=413964 RepID=A0AAW9RRX3_9BACT
MDTKQKLLRRSTISNPYVLLSIVLFLILTGLALTFGLQNALKTNTSNQALYDVVKAKKEAIMVNLNNLDMSVRGYLLVHNEAFLGTIEGTTGIQTREFHTLDSLLPVIQYDVAKLRPLKSQVNAYYDLMHQVIHLDSTGKREEALAIIKADKGTELWYTYVDFGEDFDSYLTTMQQNSQDSYDSLLQTTIIYQILMAVIGIPTLLFIIYLLNKNTKHRERLFNELSTQNNTLIFNNNTEEDLRNAEDVVQKIIHNLKKAAHFIQNITSGNYEVNWEGLNEENAALNENNLAGALVKMREQMIKVKEQDQKRHWENEGLNKITEILRKHQTNLEELGDQVVAFMVNYMEANQGGLFLLNTQDEAKKFLELRGCYAYGRKKHLQKNIEIGEGLVGQTFLEQETLHLQEIPNGYTTITSGLGEATPCTLLLIPLNYNEVTQGILEIASFKIYDQHDIAFLEKACEIIASTMISLQTNERTKKLLELSQMQAEEMRSKEEELRQNLEELEATQEEMRRKEKEMTRMLLEAKAVKS